MTADKHQPVRIFAGASDNNFLFSAAEEEKEEERWNKSSCARSHNTEKRKGFFFFVQTTCSGLKSLKQKDQSGKHMWMREQPAEVFQGESLQQLHPQEIQYLHRFKCDCKYETGYVETY